MEWVIAYFVMAIVLWCCVMIGATLNMMQSKEEFGPAILLLVCIGLVSAFFCLLWIASLPAFLITMVAKPNG